MIAAPRKKRINPWGILMPTHLVNLDALIIREDFEVQNDGQPSPGSNRTTLAISELAATSNTYNILRKPDFQRETANWEPAAVMELVRCFLDGDLIPSVILWRSPHTGNIFVIDGAHRLSALIAWVHDDYGDGEISRKFFANVIPPEQLLAADKTRKIINKEIGSYQALRAALMNPQNSEALAVKRAKNSSAFQVDCQWVSGDASKAESSFFVINQKAVPIHPTELRVLQSRRKPNALATRALIHAGVGHKYWSAFDGETQATIENLSKEIYGILFEPSLESPIKTLDLPIAGRGYSATSFQLIFEFVNFVNKCTSSTLEDDPNGTETIEFLKRLKKIATRMSGNNPGSLGLHPVVYFYTATGRYQPAAFLGVVEFFEMLEKHDSYFAFTSVRSRFENLLLKYRFFLNQAVRKFGGGTKAAHAIFQMYEFLFVAIKDGKSDEDAISDFLSTKEFSYLKAENEYDRTSGASISPENKSAAFLRTTIDGAPTCQICGARIHRKGMSYDHITRVQNGGTGDSDNIQITHPYCNTGYKEKLLTMPQ